MAQTDTGAKKLNSGFDQPAKRCHSDSRTQASLRNSNQHSTNMKMTTMMIVAAFSLIAVSCKPAEDAAKKTEEAAKSAAAATTEAAKDAAGKVTEATKDAAAAATKGAADVAKDVSDATAKAAEDAAKAAEPAEEEK
jgi:hypothetical protein